MPPKEKEPAKEDPLLGCPVPVPKIDEADLLSDVRNPNFLEACKKLRIDPIDLKPRPYESFKGKGADDVKEKQQVRFAMYERGRFMKWKALGDQIRSMPPVPPEKRLAATSIPNASRGKKKGRRSVSALGDDLSHTKLGEIMSKTQSTFARGQVEVFKAASKPLKDIAYEGRFIVKKAAEDTRDLLEKRQLAEHRRKELIKKHEMEAKKKKERMRKDREEREEREAKFREQDEAERQRNLEKYEAWQEESKAKVQKQLEHFQKVHNNVLRQEREKEEQQERLLAEMREKAAIVEANQKSWLKGKEEQRVGDQTFEEKAAEAAERRRAEVAKNQAERQRQLAIDQKKQQLAEERKEVERIERAKENERKRREREKEHRKRIADIQRSKREKMKAREESIMDHMQKVEESLQRQKEERERDLAVKAEVERLRREQALDNVKRERARQAYEASILHQKHEDRAALQRGRDDLLQDILRERAVNATQVRLHKDHIKDEIFNIKCTNSYNRANQLLKELEPK
uniref:Uncharacterized protein n=1 Tax=Hemiselmis andersenii TaxID=464988 RepID=A0A6U5CN42_HEMAN|mmetsp:Transcript_7750/g.18873  ORF Transcript_7750/g.18873 Transcript_7750/m.18873 type:complete len:517 (+) Transcript_7750:885-2435(+)